MHHIVFNTLQKIVSLCESGLQVSIEPNQADNMAWVSIKGRRDLLATVEIDLLSMGLICSISSNGILEIPSLRIQPEWVAEFSSYCQYASGASISDIFCEVKDLRKQDPQMAKHLTNELLFNPNELDPEQVNKSNVLYFANYRLKSA